MTQPAVVIDIPGTPVAKGRHRTGRSPDRKIVHFTPGRTRKWERFAGALARAAMRGRRPFSEPLTVKILASIPIPGSWPEWKQGAAANGVVVPTGKPDEDNITKAVKDSMNGIVWVDDSQVISTTCDKRYSLTPGVRVSVTRLDLARADVCRRDQLPATG